MEYYIFAKGIAVNQLFPKCVMCVFNERKNSVVRCRKHRVTKVSYYPKTSQSP